MGWDVGVFEECLGFVGVGVGLVLVLVGFWPSSPLAATFPSIKDGVDRSMAKIRKIPPRMKRIFEFLVMIFSPFLKIYL